MPFNAQPKELPKDHGTIWAAHIFVVVVSVLIAVIVLFSYHSSLANGSVSETASGAPAANGQVGVSATVEDFLGTRLFDSGFGKAVYQVYGNISKGFAIINSESGERVYNYTSMPGDGVQIEVNNKNNYTVTPNY